MLTEAPGRQEILGLLWKYTQNDQEQLLGHDLSQQV